ncbi:hypothetical protein ACR2Z6_001232 [Vibrio cholerae]
MERMQFRHLAYALFILIISGCTTSKHISTNPINTFSNGGPDFKNKVVFTTLPVGAGNCQIVSCPKSSKVIINDCGSTGKGDLGLDPVTAAYTIEAIRNEINAKELALTVSHSDLDHNNYLEKVTETLQFFYGETPYTLTFLGGDVTKYNKATLDTLKKASQQVYFSKPDTPESFTNYEPGLSCEDDDYKTWILLNNFGSNANSKSLVTVSLINNGKTSVYFTGDMEGTTSAEIIERYNKNKFNNLDLSKVTESVLTIPHHGATTNNSSNIYWAAFTNPNILVVSAGSKHGHPGCDAVNMYTNLSATVGSGIHKFTCYKDGYKQTIDTDIYKYLTEENGSIYIELTGQPASISWDK